MNCAIISNRRFWLTVGLSITAFIILLSIILISESQLKAKDQILIRLEQELDTTTTLYGKDLKYVYLEPNEIKSVSQLGVSINKLKPDLAWNDNFTFSINYGPRYGFNTVSYVIIANTNGEVKHIQKTLGRVINLRPQTHGEWPFSYHQYDKTLTEPILERSKTFRVVLTNQELQTEQYAGVVAPLRHTDHHDFLVTPEGNYIFISYNYAERDFQNLTPENSQGLTKTEDSVIQMTTPAGEVLWTWDSWDHIALKDCQTEPWPFDYAHLNTLELTENNQLLVSLRGCSSVMLLDIETGETIWSLGTTLLSESEWLELDEPMPLKITGDPLKEFCAQHSATFTGPNTIALFDNGSVKHCKHRKINLARVVEYEIDLDNHEAKFIREFRNPCPVENPSIRWHGHVVIMENQDWWISWGRHATPDSCNNSISQVHWKNNTAQEVLTVRIEGHTKLNQEENETLITKSTRSYPITTD